MANADWLCWEGRHSYILTYRRPARLLWRRAYMLRCLECPLCIRDWRPGGRVPVRRKEPGKQSL